MLNDLFCLLNYWTGLMLRWWMLSWSRKRALTAVRNLARARSSFLSWTQRSPLANLDAALARRAAWRLEALRALPGGKTREKNKRVARQSAGRRGSVATGSAYQYSSPGCSAGITSAFLFIFPIELL